MDTNDAKLALEYSHRHIPSTAFKHQVEAGFGCLLEVTTLEKKTANQSRRRPLASH
jgi:hypothetical protein